jgi:hypothetical protein
VLFDLGFPDPRGCEYREIEVTVSGVWEESKHAVSTRGWVLPQQQGGAERHAICWNGLIYPLKTVGSLVDLEDDVAALVPPREQRFNTALAETVSVLPTNSPSSRVLLLLRLGEVDTALKNWVPNWQVMIQAQVGMNHSGQETSRKQYDPFLELAQDWAWAQFDRVLSAHMRGDVPLAVAAARQLVAVQPGIEAEAERRGFPHPSYGDSLKHETPRPYLYFLDQLPRIVTDLERRAREPKTLTVMDRGLTNIASSSKRVAALIRDLDMVRVRQMSQPGMVMPEMDPLVQALIKEGDEAVAPLIDCLENDTRLTRSVGFSRDFHRNRVVIPVSSAARAALQHLLQVQFRTAPEFRSYWKTNRGIKIQDRWYATLADDRAGMEQWLQAARNILQLDNVSGVPGLGRYTTAPLEPGQTPTFRGESLRGRQNPSVSELLLKRANDAATEARKLDQHMAVMAVRNGTELTALLSQWADPATAVPPARALARRSIELFADRNSFIMSSGRDLSRHIPRLTQLRVSGGDTNALDEYAQWIQTANPDRMDTDLLAVFEPLYRNPAQPVVGSAAESLFNNPASPWSRLPWKMSGFRNPVETDLMEIPAFRQMVIRELDRREKIGWMQFRSPDRVEYSITNLQSGSRGIGWPESERPADGARVELRHCDWVAWLLSNAKRIAFFNPFVSEDERDKGIDSARHSLAEN